MGLQSSRIIWGKTKLPGTNPLTPITLYDDSDTVYISGNYAIYSVSSGSVSQDYRLYLCGAAETGGVFEPDDWKEQKGVKNWDLEGHRAYNVNARVIKELHGVEYTYTDEEGHEQTITLDGVYLFKCITKTPPDHAWHQECWELVFQEVGLAYIARDHKEVYYNGKFHKAMYFMPPEAQDEEDFEVIDFNEEWRYHFGDLMIYNKYNTEKGNKCYKYVSNIPSAGTYEDSKWEIQNNPDNQPIAEYEANIAYPKDYKCIKRQIVIYEQVICEYDGYHLKYNTGKYCVYKIDKDDYLQREIDAGERLYPNWYRDKIINGEDIYGLFRAKRVTGNGSAFNQNDWDLINYRDGHYVLQWIPVNNGEPYSVGDERIYYFRDTEGAIGSIMGLSRCIQAHITPTTANCPTNSEYWETVDQNIDSIDSYRLYRANRDISAEDNTHFIAKNFSIVTQKMLMDEELYGIVWRKIGTPGADGYVYCFMFTSIGPTNISSQSYKGRYCMFLPAYYNDGELSAQDEFTLYLESGRRLRGNGFTDIKNYMLFSYGIADLYSIGNAVYANFIYAATADGWKRTDLSRYFNFRQFVALQNNAFFAADENDDIYKVQFIPGSANTETLVTPSNGYFYREMLDSEFLIVEHANRVVSLNTHIAGLYGAQVFRYYISENLAQIGEHCYEIGMPPGTQTDSQYLIFTKDTLIGSDVISAVGYSVSDKYVGSYSDYQEFCDYWGLTYSNGYILNYPELNEVVERNSHTFTSFKGDKLYFLRYARNANFFIGKIVEVSKGITLPSIHNVAASDSLPASGLNFYCRYENHLYAISTDGVWDINLSEPGLNGDYALTKIRNLATSADVLAAKCVTGIPYVTGAKMHFENKEVNDLTLYFVDGEISRHSYSYDSTTETLSVYIPINDRNIFSCNTGLAVQSNFGTFFRDRLSVGSKHYGIYVYLPEFDGVNCSNTGGYFWISYGYSDGVNGPFIGGAGTDYTNF